MTTFNGVDYVARQLSSIAAQTYRPLEIIISDDGSTDGTLQALEALRDIFPFKLFTRNSPLGVNENLAFALRECSGDLIAIADQDDIWEPEKLEALIGALGEYDAVFSDSSLIDSNSKPIGGTLMEYLLEGDRPKVGTEPMYFILQNVVSGHALLFRRKLLVSALPFVSDYYYDQQLAIVASLGKGIVYLDRPLVQHRQHPNNTNNHLFSKSKTKQPPRLVRATRMALHLRAGVRYVLDVSIRMAVDSDSVRRLRHISRLLDAKSLLGRLALLLHVVRNRERLFPYQSRSRRLKWSRRLITGLRNTQLPKDS